MSDFEGFGKGFFDFFRELAKHNERPWFEANKDRYKETVVAPCLAFITAMAPRLEKISQHYVADPRPNGGSMFRIYRDVRFAKDKRPYKEHAAMQFRHHRGRDAHAPGFYVHLEPGRVFLGGGIWRPPSPDLALIRARIAKDPAGWSKVVGDKTLKKVAGGIRGDALKRPPKGFTGEEKHIEDIKRQSFFAMAEMDEKVAGSAKFLDRAEAGFKAATPLMRFLCKAVDVPF